MRPTTRLRDDCLQIWRRGLAAVVADDLVERSVRVDGGMLWLGETALDVEAIGRIHVVGGGKAGAGMAEGLERALSELLDRIELSGLISVPQGSEAHAHRIEVRPTRPPGANEPTEAAAEATATMLAQVSQLGSRDVCIALLSGGGSALLPAPRSGLTLADKLAVTRLLSDSGANIEQLNIVRRQLSRIKGGGLARQCRAGTLVALIISDVLGDRLDTIASGPTVVSTTTAVDALRVLAQYDPGRGLPAAVYDCLQKQVDSEKTREPIRTHVHNEIIGNNAVAVDAAGVVAEKRGYSHAMNVATSSEGAAEGVGTRLAEMTVRMLRSGGPDCLITGGEPVVALTPPGTRGRGGRNQHLVLAALDWLQREGKLTAEERQRFVLLSGGTDGEDGPTDAAGAFLDAEVWSRAEQLGLSPRDYLNRCDAYSFFERTGGLLKTGPTGTNVCDIRVVCVAR